MENISRGRAGAWLGCYVGRLLGVRLGGRNLSGGWSCGGGKMSLNNGRQFGAAGCLGDEAFRKELLAQMAERAGPFHYGEELMESAEEKAQWIVPQEMGRLGWKEEDLEQHRKGNQRKVKIARRLRRETTMTMKWIADRLKMGTWTHVTNRLYHLKN